MKKLVIEGGNRLNGLLHISGAKNASLPILMASILINGKSKVFNVPSVADITTTIELLTYLGASLEINNDEIDGKKAFIVDAKNINTVEAPYEIVSKMRASFWVLGSLLGRFGEAKVSLPGGCAIGPRPCDIYIDALEKMNVDIRIENGYVLANAKSSNKKLKGADISLRFPSVGATHNTIMAATLAEGRTVIRNAAKEPEIVDLCNYLLNAGADISNAGTDTIIINGVEESLTMYFNPMNHHYMADLGYSLSNGDQISLQYQGFNIAFSDITSTFAVDSSQAISIAVGHLENDLKSFYQNNQFKGECYLKILTMQDDESGSLFWYFSAVSQDGDKLDIVISTADGSVIID